MKVKIIENERQIEGSSTIPFSNYFHVDTCGKNFDFYLFNDGRLTIKNRGVSQTRNGKFNGTPLELNMKDIPYVEPVIEHWKTIRPKILYLCNNPSGSGSGLLYPGDEIGNSIDNRFSSNGCIYTFKRPFEQHYHHGRFDYYLYNETISIEDEKSIQNFSRQQADAVLGILYFIAENPLNITDRLTLNEELVEVIIEKQEEKKKQEERRNQKLQK